MENEVASRIQTRDDKIGKGVRGESEAGRAPFAYAELLADASAEQSQSDVPQGRQDDCAVRSPTSSAEPRPAGQQALE